MKCKLCEKEFEPRAWCQKFCSYSCRDKYRNLLSTKEIIRLSEEDKCLRNKILKNV